MRELIVTQNITLDGVIDAAEGWFDASGEEGVDQSASSRRNRARASSSRAACH
jgi:hypothetical protein